MILEILLFSLSVAVTINFPEINIYRHSRKFDGNNNIY